MADDARLRTKDTPIYIGMKIVLTIGAGIAIGIVVLISAPDAGHSGDRRRALLRRDRRQRCRAYVGMSSRSLRPSLRDAFCSRSSSYLVSLISVPAIVFFPAYSIYFFAARYRPLSLALYSPRQPAIGGSPQPRAASIANAVPPLPAT